VVVGRFHNADELETALEVLTSADIPCSADQNDPSAGPARMSNHQYFLTVPAAFREQAEKTLRSEIFDPEAEADYQHHFEELSDEELLALNTEGLGEAARRMLDEELAERRLESAPPPVETHGDVDGGLEMVGAFASLEEADSAQGLLQTAGIACSLENQDSQTWSGAGEIRLLVSAADYDRACEILEAQIGGDPEV